MKQQKVKSLGVELSISVPATADEFDKLAKREGACVDEANSNVLYRSFLTESRGAMIEGFFAENEDGSQGACLFEGYANRFGAVRKRKQKDSGKKKKDGSPILTWDEGEEDYLEYIRAEKNVSDSEFAADCTTLAALIAFDPAKTVSVTKPKALAAEYLENGKKLFAARKFEEFNKRLVKHQVLFQGKPAEYIPVVPLEGETQEVVDKKNVEQLGWLAKAFLDKAAADAKAKAAQGLGV